MMKDKDKICHIYAQKSWHMDSYIIGNREGLIELKSAIDQALKSNVGQAELFPSDLEDYTTYVALVNDKEELDSLIMPYIDEDNDDENLIHPVDIVTSLEEKKTPEN
ncbi:hypothetical protein [Bacillus pumilus]|uniref:hypothetical protein n=1 Tax=Bacillus pumilus TaxID=1408 RepID=UPI001CB9859D|nr:hypothetical protein [Bacillus pumilus]MCY7500445.1 hypothetical protein [Bacillus pumilus]MCY7527002.1 hypothetical protein [Bacillus pumilus]MED4440851.1 hypothetical protein [Bacillus pumilus]MED4491914.1 hypothetical protein [Bacillus pumilus]